MENKILYSKNPENWRETADFCVIAVGKNRIVYTYNGFRRTPVIAAAYFWQSGLCTGLPEDHKPTEHDAEIIKTVMALPAYEMPANALLYTEAEYKAMKEEERRRVLFVEDQNGKVRNIRNEEE